MIARNNNLDEKINSSDEKALSTKLSKKKKRCNE